MAENKSSEKKTTPAGLLTDNDGQVIVIKDSSDEEKPGSLSWGAIGHYLNKFKYWVLGATLVCAIVGYVSVKYIYNPTNQKVSVEMKINVGQRSGTKCSSGNFLTGTAAPIYLLANGVTADFRNIISISNIDDTISAAHEKAVAQYLVDNPSATQDEAEENAVGEYDSLDESDLTEKSVLVFKPYLYEVSTTSGSTTTTTTMYSVNDFILTGDIALFNNDSSVAESFAMALVNNYISGLEDNFYMSDNLSIYDSVGPYDVYDQKLSLLTSQYSVLSNLYINLESQFGSWTTVDNDGTQMTLGQASANLDTSSYVSNGSAITSRQASINSNGYVDLSGLSAGYTIDEYIDYYEQQVAVYSQQAANYESQIESLQASMNNSGNSGSDTLQSAITSLTSQLSAAKQNMIYSQNKVDNLEHKKDNDGEFKEPSTEFISYFSEAKDFINGQTTALESISKQLMFSDSSAVLASATGGSPVTFDGGASGYIGALIGAALGFIVAACVVTIKGQYDRQKSLALTGIDPVTLYTVDSNGNSTKVETVKPDGMVEATAVVPVKKEEQTKDVKKGADEKK